MIQPGPWFPLGVDRSGDAGSGAFGGVQNSHFLAAKRQISFSGSGENCLNECQQV